MFRAVGDKKEKKQTTMDRVKSSMQQVPNAIPKVIRRTGGANSLELEKENFERGQVRSAERGGGWRVTLM